MRKAIKDLMDYVKEFIENIEMGNDMSDFSFIIKYKNGTIVYVNIDTYNDKFSRNINNIEYIVAIDPCDSWDSNGKSWYRDFCHNTIDYDYDTMDKINNDWNEYINSMLY